MAVMYPMERWFDIMAGTEIFKGVATIRDIQIRRGDSKLVGKFGVEE